MPNVSVIITALNAANSLPSCLEALKEFDDVIVIDSNSKDGSKDICKKYNVSYVPYEWNGQYPKKRQWVLNNVQTKYDYIFFVDADEIVTPDLVAQISTSDLSAAGYFVKGQYEMSGTILRHGLQNNKLSLFHRDKFEFPIIDDLVAKTMGEIEGHYQPVLKTDFIDARIEQMSAPLIHRAYDENWEERHDRYAQWEAYMILGDRYPQENKKFREILKRIFRKMPMRGLIAFIHSYVLKFGFLDGKAGYNFAYSRLHYYNKVSVILKANRV